MDPADYPMVKPNLAATIDRSVFPGVQGGPLLHVVAGKAVALKLAMTEEFRDYQARVVANARVIGETLQSLGARLMTGGTDNHLILVDVTPLGDHEDATVACQGELHGALGVGTPDEDRQDHLRKQHEIPHGKNGDARSG